MRRTWTYLALFFVVAAGSGVIYWLRSEDANWWAYLDRPEGRLSKFKLTLPEQLVISGVVGSLIAASVSLVVFCIEALGSRRTTHVRCDDERQDPSSR